MYGCGYLFVRELAKWLQSEENIENMESQI